MGNERFYDYKAKNGYMNFKLRMEHIYQTKERVDNNRKASKELVKAAKNELRKRVLNEEVYARIIRVIRRKYKVKTMWELTRGMSIPMAINEVEKCSRDESYVHLLIRLYKNIRIDSVIKIVKNYIEYVLECHHGNTIVDIEETNKYVYDFCSLSPELTPEYFYDILVGTGLECYIDI